MPKTDKNQHLIKTQFYLAILVALEEIGEPATTEKIIQKTEKFWKKWKRNNPELQERPTISGHLSDLREQGKITAVKDGRRNIYSWDSRDEPRSLIGECLRELFWHIPISFNGTEVLFVYDDYDYSSLIFDLRDIRDIILRYDLSEYV
jgi:DNA-binding transcriptional ArsR family regulator